MGGYIYYSHIDKLKPLITVKSTAKVRARAYYINYDTKNYYYEPENETVCLICGEPGYTTCKSCKKEFPVKQGSQFKKAGD